ncbi:TIGR02594 family protein [Sphingosinithalassobacter portus]|uniref:NlpC/P60 family protein n=1 Tax=Stakelama portus TaxID=2676234 RepID=UPI000D6E5D9C|nr:TIGR02594 family protein [Sphingosinithalassobacter portus]
MPSYSRDEVVKIQHTLARKGFDPGPVDGVWGRRTEAAVRAFQAASGLIADGIVGPRTRKVLFGDDSQPAPVDDPGFPWFQEARHLLGVREDTSARSNPQILDWASDIGIPYRSDDIAWCGLFVAHCVAATMAHEPLPTNPLGARNWLKFGAPCQPQVGAVLVFWRGSASGWKGHVGFYAAQTPGGDFYVLGGNQSDKVSIAKIARNRLLGARWPATAPELHSAPHVAADDGSIFSTDES